FVAASMLPMRTVGVLWVDERNRMMAVGSPMGVIAGVIPVTNPTSTVLFKCMAAVKAGNAIVCAPHPRAARCCTRAAEVMAEAAEGAGGLAALTSMGARYYESLADRTTLLLQLQGFAACGDTEVRDLVRAARVAHMWNTVADTSDLDAVTVKSFLAFGMLLNNVAALDVGELDEPWAQGVRTRIHPGLFEHITTDTNR
ncbi:MAG TPA: aldehyde dehydrogenase family protein, partial [Pseudonocardiaceae bacterium]|nr:aldehyde dehydrogenase family protein [Pseudonocardiaceae bacterium]